MSFFAPPCQHSVPVLALIASLCIITIGESACKHIFKIPLCNLVGRSIERPLKSPLVNKVLTTPASATMPPTPLISTTHSLSLSRMEIKEIASRTRKELLGEVACLFTRSVRMGVKQVDVTFSLSSGIPVPFDLTNMPIPHLSYFV